MHRELERIHQKNIWMLKLLLFFYIVGITVNLIVGRRLPDLNLLIGLILLGVLALLVYIRRWPLFTMILTISFLFLFYYILILGNPNLIRYIFLGLAPLLCLIYLDLRAIVLSGFLYVILSSYFFYKFEDQIFRDLNPRDLTYIIVLGIFMLFFSVIYTKETKKFWQRAEKSENQLRTILEDVSIGIWTYDLNTMELAVSEGFEQITGYGVKTFLKGPEHFREIIHPDDQHLFDLGQKELMILHTEMVKEYRIICSNGEIKWIQNRGRSQVNHLKNLTRIEGVVIDITERKQLEESIQFLAYHDELTGLPNRTLLSIRFKEYSKRGHFPLAILFIDLDNFKDVNDTYGHIIGDSLLKDIANRMLELVREQDTICRLGGDEFVVLLTEMDESRVVRVADRIRASLQQGFVYDGFKITAGASIGICVSLQGNSNLEEMIQQADGAMYDAKKNNDYEHKAYGDIAYSKN